MTDDDDDDDDGRTMMTDDDDGDGRQIPASGWRMRPYLAVFSRTWPPGSVYPVYTPCITWVHPCTRRYPRSRVRVPVERACETARTAKALKSGTDGTTHWRKVSAKTISNLKCNIT